MSVPAALHWLPEEQTLAGLRPGDAAKVLTILTEMVEASKHPFPKAADEAAAANARMMQFFAADQKRMPWDRHMLAQMLLPALNKVFGVSQERASQQRIDLASVAVERFRLRHGKLPEKLDQLLPEFLDSMPLDPYTGKPLTIVIDGEDYSISGLSDAAKGKVPGEAAQPSDEGE